MPTSSRKSGTEADGVRLNRFLARAGCASRRSCDSMIFEGLVTVNGVVEKSPARRILPGDDVRLSGRPVFPARASVYALNKPLGVEVTMAGGRGDEFMALIRETTPGSVPVGRLDVNTGGLLLLTNDGELSQRLMHPRYGIEREYLLEVRRGTSAEAAAALGAGAPIGPGRPCIPASCRPVGRSSVALVLTSGRYHEVRRLAAAVGVALLGLERIRYGPVRLGGLPRRAIRELSPDEMAGLYGSVGLDSPCQA